MSHRQLLTVIRNCPESERFNKPAELLNTDTTPYYIAYNTVEKLVSRDL